MASFLHTIGAIGYLAGIAFFIGWARSLRRGHHSPSVLATGAALTYVSIFANLVGGFLRTYQPGHPSLTALFDEPWVMVMTIKHIALFAGIFAAVWLFEIEAPRMMRAKKAGTLRQLKDTRPRAMASVVILSIIVAAVLGGVSTVVAIGDEPEPPVETEEPPEDPTEFGPYHFEGQITTGSTSRGTFDVHAGANITAVLTVAPAGPFSPAQATLVLRDPSGAATQGTTPSDPTALGRVIVEVPDAFAGTWTYEVSGDVAFNTDWTLDITLS